MVQYILNIKPYGLVQLRAFILAKASAAAAAPDVEMCLCTLYTFIFETIDVWTGKLPIFYLVDNKYCKQITFIKCFILDRIVMDPSISCEGMEEGGNTPWIGGNPAHIQLHRGAMKHFWGDIPPTCMFLSGGRKPVYPEEIHIDMQRSRETSSCYTEA